MLGKLTWAAIPFDQPIPLAASGLMIVVVLGVLAWITVQRLLALSVARMDHLGRSQAHRRDVLRCSRW